MQVLALIALILKSLFKFRQSYYLAFKVHLFDITLLSFLTSFLLLSLILLIIQLPYSYNVLFIIFLTSLFYTVSMLYLHWFYHQTALSKFFLSLKQPRDDLDFALNTLID